MNAKELEMLVERYRLGESELFDDIYYETQKAVYLSISTIIKDKSTIEDLMQEAYKRLNRALLEVGVEYGYGYILNTDDNNCPYINPVIGFDVTELVRQKLGLVVVPEAQQNVPVAPVEEQVVVPQE